MSALHRELRLALALGGTGSHGAFGGAAVTQAVKLALAHAAYGPEGERRPYDRVCIDVLSGAGLGALALAAVLRNLASPDADEDRTESASRRLELELGERFGELTPRVRRDLVAAQLSQDAQTDLWTPPDDHDPGGGLSMRKLLGGVNGWSRDLTHEAGLLDGRAVADLARRTLGFDGRHADLARRRVLGRRVLFGCTLTNYAPVLHRDTGPLRPEETGLIGLGGGLRNRVHKEMRVFDLRFEPPPAGRADVAAGCLEPPEQHWVRCFNNFNADAGRDKDLRSGATWDELADTVVACGAVPFAMGPASLVRYRYEFAEGVWPASLAGLDRYPFTYFHAGDLSSEPVREAYRLAAHLDGRPPLLGEMPFDRRVIYVDPTPGGGADLNADLGGQLAVPSFREFGLLNASAGTVGRSTSLERILPLAGGLASALHDQAEVREAEKVQSVRETFALRRTLRPALLAALAAEPSPGAVAGMADLCRKLLRRGEADPLFPTCLKLDAELRRVVAENPCELAGLAGMALDEDHSPASPEASQWLAALALVAADGMLGLAGKYEAAGLIAISPYAGVGALRGAAVGRGDLSKLTPLELPGAKFGGLAGFMSATAARVAIDHGKACAAEFLFACGLTDAPPNPALRPTPAVCDAEAQTIADDVHRGIGHLADRVGSMVRQWGGLKFGLLTGPVRALLGSWAARRVLAMLEAGGATPHEFRLFVPPGDWGFAGGRLFDRRFKPLEVGGRRALICFARRDDSGTWRGPQVFGGDSLRVTLRDVVKADVPLPGSAAVERAGLWPNPVFEIELGEGGHLAADDWSINTGVGELSP